MLKKLTRKTKDFYQSKPLLNALGNTAGIYCAMKAAGAMLAYATGDRDLDNLADLLAPAASGLYLSHRSKEIEASDKRDSLQAIITGAVCADMTHTISNYEGIMAVHFFHDYMHGVSTAIAKWSEVNAPEAQAFLFGLSSAAVYKFFKKL